MGTPFRFRTQDQNVADELARLFGEFPTTSRATRAHNIVQVTGRSSDLTGYHDCLRLKGSGAELFPNLVSSVNNYAINQTSLFAVHAGVVRRFDRIVALPAVSGHGKSTLTGSLLRHGFDFLSDEALAFDDQGTVIPYPKPLALSRWSSVVLGLSTWGEETLATAEDLGARASDGGRLTDIIVSEYGHEAMKLESLPKSQAVAALIEYSFNHYKNPAHAYHTVTEVAREVMVWRLEYADPTDAAEVITASLG